MTIAIFHQKYEKVLKTTQNVPKTVDNHQEQLVLGLLCISILVILASRRPKKTINNKNAIVTPFLPF